MPIGEVTRNVPEQYLNKGAMGSLKSGYLKIIGEKNPVVSDKILITGDPESANFSIHEYIWNLGFLGPLDQKNRPIHWEDSLTSSEDAITVQFLFHTKGTKYSVRAFKAVIKAPFMVRSSLIDKIADGWMKIAGTTISSAGEIANIPGTKQVSTILDTINELNKDTAPSSHSYSWYSKMICAEQGKSLVDGVEWNISKRAFKNIGNQLMGGVVLMFFEPEKEENGKDDPKSLDKSIDLEGRARISYDFDHRDLWIPWDPSNENFEKNKLVLRLYPQKPENRDAKKEDFENPPIYL